MSDQLFGGEEDDILRGGPGDDSMSGGDGADLLDYSGSPDDPTPIGGQFDVAVTLSTDANSGSGDDAEGSDSFNGIEDVFGSMFNDQIVGNDEGNLLLGSDGDDTLNGRGGGDALKGSSAPTRSATRPPPTA